MKTKLARLASLGATTAKVLRFVFDACVTMHHTYVEPNRAQSGLFRKTVPGFYWEKSRRISDAAEENCGVMCAARTSVRSELVRNELVQLTSAAVTTRI